MKNEIDKNNSSMRFALIMCVVTACIIGIGAGIGFILGILLNRDLALIGASLGGLAGIIGAILVPAFSGKAIQKFAEQDKSNYSRIDNK
jgi:hypothetical protein